MQLHSTDPTDRLLPDRIVADRYGVCLKTIGRWDKDEKLGFPEPVVINGRKYRSLSKLEAFERKRAAASHREAA